MKFLNLASTEVSILIFQAHFHVHSFWQPKMTKSESFSWQPTNKGCTGLNDFGLLRDTPEHDQKPKPFSLYFSRTVLIVGIVAGFTFAVRFKKLGNYFHLVWHSKQIRSLLANQLSFETPKLWNRIKLKHDSVAEEF